MAVYLCSFMPLVAQGDTLTQKPVHKNADDPSQFLKRIKIFNEFQNYDYSEGFNLNQTVALGAQLGYQFIIWKRVALDFVLIGPSVAGYALEAKLDTYGLEYQVSTDHLIGTYYQAVEKNTYDVEFVRER